MLRIILITTTILLLNGCSYKPTITIDQNSSQEFKKFKGLNDIFSSASQDVVVFYVHGMGTHTSDEDETINFFDNVALEMGFSKEEKHIKHNLKINNKIVGDIALKTYPGEKRDFVLVSLSWSKSTEYIEKLLHHASNPYGDRIAPLNKEIKAMMNEGFADAVLYLNPHYKKVVHSVIEMGIEKAYSLRPELKGNHNVLVSSSLGSKMVFDIIKTNYHINKVSAYNDFFNNLQQVFMTSNQIPLLDLFEGDYLKRKNKQVSSTLLQMDEILGFTSKQMKFLRDNKKLPIITFSDPNDALSYYIYYTPLNKIDFINVTISHSKWWWFTYLANPMKAHAGMKTEEHGYKALVKGSSYFTFKKYKYSPMK